MQWGNLAEWLGAIGTVGAFGLTYLLLRRELAAQRVAADERARLEQERQRQVEEQTAEQARQVSAWMKATVTKDAGAPTGYLVALRNGSREPVYDVKATVNAQSVAVYHAKLTFPILPPGSTQEVFVEARMPPKPTGAIVLDFRDARGIRWTRPPNGKLRRAHLLPAPERRVVTVKWTRQRPGNADADEK